MNALHDAHYVRPQNTTLHRVDLNVLARREGEPRVIIFRRAKTNCAQLFGGGFDGGGGDGYATQMIDDFVTDAVICAGGAAVELFW